MTKKAYIEDIKERLHEAGASCQSVKEFGPRKMKAAYQGINERQAGRLNQLKEQMKESLIESHSMQNKLQSSLADHSGTNRNHPS